jgi:hypothetical protein
MATWHQQRARARLYHDTLWAVVTDPPGECTSSMLFNTEQEAKAYLERIKALGKGEHTYVLRPAKVEGGK